MARSPKLRFHRPDLFAEPPPPPAAPEPFRCEVCGEVACHGFGVRLLQGRRGRWFCSAHKPEEVPR